VSANYIAKWNGTSWSALGSGMNSTVQALISIGTDLYAGGQFTTAGGVSVNYIARWDTLSQGWNALDSGMDSFVYAFASLGTDGLYAGGNFSVAGGFATGYFAKWANTGIAANTDASTEMSAVTDTNGNVYLAYTDSSHRLLYKRFDAAAALWSASMTLASGAAASPAISVDSAGHNLAAFWIDSNTIYGKNASVAGSSTTWSASPVTIYSTGINADLNVTCTMNNSRVLLTWTNGSSSPYDVKSAVISLANSPSIFIAGNWANSGAFNAGAGTVNFTGAGTTSVITGATAFYDLSAVAGKTLRFGANTTFTVQNNLTLTGTSGNLIVLDRDGGSGLDQFTFSIAKDQTVSYVNVSNSNVTGTANKKITANDSLNTANNDTTAGSDPYWYFPSAGITISGNVYDSYGGSLVSDGTQVGLAVNGSLTGGYVLTTAGAYSFSSISVNSGNAILVFIYNNAIDGNTVTIAQDSTTNIANLHIYGLTLTVSHENAGPITNTVLETAKGALVSGDIIYSVNNVTKKLDLNAGLNIPTG